VSVTNAEIADIFERLADLLGGRGRQFAITVAEQLDLCDSEDRRGTTQLPLADGGELLSGADRRLPCLPGLAAGRRHEHDPCAFVSVLAGHAARQKRLVVRVGEDQQQCPGH